MKNESAAQLTDSAMAEAAAGEPDTWAMAAATTCARPPGTARSAAAGLAVEAIEAAPGVAAAGEGEAPAAHHRGHCNPHSKFNDNHQTVCSALAAASRDCTTLRLSNSSAWIIASCTMNGREAGWQGSAPLMATASAAASALPPFSAVAAAATSAAAGWPFRDRAATEASATALPPAEESATARALATAWKRRRLMPE